ncbi:MAG: hypothetical protein AB1522_14185 [Chloroflexota bacterium]
MILSQKANFGAAERKDLTGGHFHPQALILTHFESVAIRVKKLKPAHISLFTLQRRGADMVILQFLMLSIHPACGTIALQ